MVYVEEIKGKSMNLRPVEISDAEFLVKIRNDEKLAKYLHPISSSVEDEKQWILKQRDREGDYFFMICDLADKPIGAVRLSGIDDNSGEVGSLISYGNSVQNIEAEFRMINFAFDVIGLDFLHGYTLTENRAVISYHKKFGYVYEDEEKVVDGMKVRFARLEKNEWKKNRDKIERLLKHVE